ncbi:MAG TPA: SufE family protein [Amoebophilaceae bacterium]|jgi:cysteine desulfuration protein SufE|nr:SufE family protein [Amoebophilaceae bacterium]
MPKIQTKTIEHQQDEIIDAFATLSDDREAMLEYLIDLGHMLAPMDPAYKTDAYLVPGCMSQVWLADREADGILVFQADSNTAITKGLVSLLVKVLSGQPIQTIATAKLYFVETVGIQDLVGFQRANGFLHMMKEIKIRALARLHKQ